MTRLRSVVCSDFEPDPQGWIKNLEFKDHSMALLPNIPTPFTLPLPRFLPTDGFHLPLLLSFGAVHYFLRLGGLFRLCNP
ncbi:hypothetical protein V5O48_017965 [Marasmius crinis-equi]|uniref:Uncharacterized protein n=1 Tax=Marasmius crinis-equi TaxID=585013 RepID=A0ABR3EMM6_9AGAR